jgi:hypothetical protein
MGDVSTKLMKHRRENEAFDRMGRVMASMRMWRRTLITELAAAEDEVVIDLLHWEIMKSGKLIRRMTWAMEEVMKQHVERPDDVEIKEGESPNGAA